MTTTCAASCWRRRLQRLLAGLAGGVAQTTPYIGHPAFKEMGARSGYTLLTGVFVGAGGMLGFLANLIELVPLAALAPVLVFLALNITAQAFSAVPARHAVAVAISFFPSIARLLTIELSDPKFVSPQKFAALMTAPEHGLPAVSVIVALGNGFIITATIWAAFVVEMVERRLRSAALYLALGGVLCFLWDHSLRAPGWQRLSAAAVGRCCAQCRDPILRCLLCAGRCVGAAVFAAAARTAAKQS